MWLTFSDQWGPLAQGKLARATSQSGSTLRSQNEKFMDADEEIIARVEELADKKGWKMSHVALAWINKRISSPIIGFSSVERMDEALEVKGKTLTDEEERLLEELYKTKPILGHS